MIECYEVVYAVGKTNFHGFVAMEANGDPRRPCIMLAPDWAGRGEAICQKAKDFAAQGYIGFALDMYGEARLGHTLEERRALLYPLKENRREVCDRILAAFEQALLLPQVDSNKIAALGYCFGGMCVLDLARLDVPVRGVVSFHGLLNPPPFALSEQIQAKILIAHGYEDPLVAPESVQGFCQEMTAKKADWQLHIYGHTKHSFTNPEAHDEALGLEFNAKANARATIATDLFLKESLELKR